MKNAAEAPLRLRWLCVGAARSRNYGVYTSRTQKSAKNSPQLLLRLPVNTTPPQTCFLSPVKNLQLPFFMCKPHVAFPENCAARDSISALAQMRHRLFQLWFKALSSPGPEYRLPKILIISRHQGYGISMVSVVKWIVRSFLFFESVQDEELARRTQHLQATRVMKLPRSSLNFSWIYT